jgi:hypothetical protein
MYWCEDANSSVVNIAVWYHLVPKMIQNSGTVSHSAMHKPQTPVLPSYLHFSFRGRTSLKLFQRCLSFFAMKYGNSWDQSTVTRKSAEKAADMRASVWFDTWSRKQKIVHLYLLYNILPIMPWKSSSEISAIYTGHTVPTYQFQKHHSRETCSL